MTATLSRTPVVKGSRFTRFPAGKLYSPRIVVNAVEGWGKTTLGAHAPKPAILMARGESGFKTLRESNLVPDCDAIELVTWKDALAVLDELVASDHESVVLDALGGFERLCHEHVCARDFGNDWGDKGFSSYMRGYDISVADWIQLLQKLDAIRASRNVNVLLLSHCKVKTFKNPLGSDFDRYTADCHEKTWGVTHKWADAVLFGNFVTVTQEGKRGAKTKGVGGTERQVHTARTDAYDAKNRYGMAALVPVSADPSDTWGTVWEAMTAGMVKVSEAAPDL